MNVKKNPAAGTATATVPPPAAPPPPAPVASVPPPPPPPPPPLPPPPPVQKTETVATVVAEAAAAAAKPAPQTQALVTASVSQQALTIASKIADLPAHLVDVIHVGEGLTPGFENVGAAGLQLPMLFIGQPQTPAVLAGKLKTGDVFSSEEPETPMFGVGQSADFSIVYHYKEWVEWADRLSKLGILNRSKEERGDLARRCAMERNSRGAPKEKRRIGDKEVTVSVLEYHVFFIVFEGEQKPYAVPCARTMFKKGQKLISMARRRGVGALPMWSGKYSMTTVMETNDKGSWYNWEFNTAGWCAPEEKEFLKQQYENAKSMYDSIVLSMADMTEVPEAQPGDEKEKGF